MISFVWEKLCEKHEIVDRPKYEIEVFLSLKLLKFRKELPIVVCT